MERKKQLRLPDGSVRSVTELGYRPSAEYWNEYLADDGTVIRVKLVVTEIMRVDDQYDPEGNPTYILKSSNVTAISAPDELRRQEP